jgi:hypothetical protein
MKTIRWSLNAALSLWLFLSIWSNLASAQTKPMASEEKKSESVATFSPTNEAMLGSVREQLFKFLRMSPRLTRALSIDPSLLSYRDYVNHYNPELAGFLQVHPEITRNPEFYLFGNLPGGGSRNLPYLFQRAVWPDIGQDNSSDRGNDVIIFLVFLIILSAILWLLRMFLQNRRWNRIFKVQTETHAKLLDKLGGSQELFTYLGTEAGRKFLEMAPMAAAMESYQRPSFVSPLTRILAPLQLGVVATLIGIGLLVIRHLLTHSESLLLLGTLVLMLGIGLILAAGLSWILARRLGVIATVKQEGTGESAR